MTKQDVKHTPGPWEWDDGYKDNWRINEASTGNALAIILGTADNLQPGQLEANASLIATAPLMLEALQEVEWFYNGRFEDFCTYCGRSKSKGHQDTCKIGTVLKAALREE